MIHMPRCNPSVSAIRPLTAFAALLLAASTPAQEPSSSAPVAKPGSAVPVFADGQAQIVEAFKDSKLWIQHDLWVESDFDSDGDGDPDRLHVDVTRPGQTDS